MKIKYMGDLHNEFNILDITNMLPADVCILAGDINVWSDAGRNMFRWMDNLPVDHVIFTPGNHEFYHRGNITEAKQQMEMVLEKYPKINMLWNSKVEINGVTFLGTPLWSNFDKGLGNLMREAGQAINDFRQGMYDERTFWTPEKMMEENFIAEKFLEENIVLGNEIVISHWSPTRRNCAEQFIGDRLNGYFMNDMDMFIERLEPAVWVHGHTHNSSDITIGKTRILNNPRGYDPYELNPDFDINKYFEV